MTKQKLLIFTLLILLSACSDSPPDTDISSSVLRDDHTIAVAPEDSSIYASGQALYDQHCAECHGINGEGQFPEAPMQPDDTGRLGAPPHTGKGHTWHHDDDHLLRYIREGGAGDPSQFYPMPGFADVLSDEDIMTILAYIKTMWSDREQEIQQQRTLAIRQQ